MASKRVILSGVKQLNRDDQTVYDMKFVDEDDQPVDGDVSTGANVALTGYEVGEEEAVAASDTVNEAIGKLEARIVALETP